MKPLRLILGAAAIVLLAAAPVSAKPGWLTDYKQAQEEAKAKNRLILLDFTGSDWCGWCIKLDREVFSKPEFKQYAEKNLVLLEIDFPRGRDLSDKERMENEKLAMQYSIQGFPTILLLDADGKKVGRLGYESGVADDASEMRASPQAFIASLERLRKG